MPRSPDSGSVEIYTRVEPSQGLGGMKEGSREATCNVFVVEFFIDINDIILDP